MDKEMQFCMEGKIGLFKRRLEKVIMLPILTLLSLSAFYFAMTDIRELGSLRQNSIILLVMAAAFFAATNAYRAFSDPFNYRKYRVQENGILARNGLLKNGQPQEQLFHWDRIKDIRILPYGANAAMRNYETVCVCFLETPEKDIADKLAKHPTYAYRKMDKMLVMSLDETLLRSIKQYYPEPIHDDLPEYQNKWGIR